MDLATLPVAVPSEEYNPPELEEVAFEQVWAPLPLGENGESTADLDALVKEFGGVVSQDKVRSCDHHPLSSLSTVIIRCCHGHHPLVYSWGFALHNLACSVYGASVGLFFLLLFHVILSATEEYIISERFPCFSHIWLFLLTAAFAQDTRRALFSVNILTRAQAQNAPLFLVLWGISRGIEWGGRGGGFMG